MHQQKMGKSSRARSCYPLDPEGATGAAVILVLGYGDEIGGTTNGWAQAICREIQLQGMLPAAVLHWE